MRQKPERVMAIGSALKARDQELPVFDLLTLANDGPMDLLEIEVDNDKRDAISDIVKIYRNRPVFHSSSALIAA